MSKKAPQIGIGAHLGGYSGEFGFQKARQKSPRGGPGSLLVRKPGNVRFCLYLLYLRHVGQPRKSPQIVQKSFKNGVLKNTAETAPQNRRQTAQVPEMCENRVPAGFQEPPKIHQKSLQTRCWERSCVEGGPKTLQGTQMDSQGVQSGPKGSPK